MFLTLLLSLFVIAALIFVLRQSEKKNYKLPPGPPSWPFFGGYLNVLLENWNEPAGALQAFSEKYKSPVILFKLGIYKIFVANDDRTVREVFLNPALQGRPSAFPFEIRTFHKKLGFFGGDGLEWLELKRTSLRELRDLGFGRRNELFEQMMEEEARNLLKRLSDASGREVRLPEALIPPVFNVILNVVLGFKFSSDADALELARQAVNLILTINTTGCLLTAYPWIRFLAPETSGYVAMKNAAIAFENLLRQRIAEYRSSSGAPVNHLLGHHLKHQEQLKYYTDEQIISACSDLIIPNAALSFVISFAIAYLTLNPKIRQKCQKEIDDIVGRGRLPNLNDRQNLPMIEAVIRETMRCQTLTPLGVAHLSSEDTLLGGYDVPKNTIVLTNLQAINTNERLFKNPNEFRPERFLDKNQFTPKKDYTLNFGLGKRVCVGETFTRQSLFLFLATVVQNFDFEQGSVPIDFRKNRFGVARAPQCDLAIKFIPRL